MSDHAKQVTRIVLVDDHTVVRQGLALLLSDPKYGIEVVGEAADGHAAIAIAGKLQPDVILMDLVMPGMDGQAAIAAIKARQPGTCILVLTSLGEDPSIEEAIKAGAMGYVRKDSPADELVSAIHSVAMGRLSLPYDLATQLMAGRQKSTTGQGQPALTTREKEVLACLAQGLTDDEITRQLAISKPTVRSHVSQILKKLGAANRTQAARYARRLGLLDD